MSKKIGRIHPEDLNLINENSSLTLVPYPIVIDNKDNNSIDNGNPTTIQPGSTTNNTNVNLNDHPVIAPEGNDDILINDQVIDPVVHPWVHPTEPVVTPEVFPVDPELPITLPKSNASIGTTTLALGVGGLILLALLFGSDKKKKK